MTDDSDDTEGRRLYRAKADALATAQTSMAQRKIKPIMLIRLTHTPPHRGADNGSPETRSI